MGECQAHDQKVVGSNFTWLVISELNWIEKVNDPVVYGAVNGPGT